MNIIIPQHNNHSMSIVFSVFPIYTNIDGLSIIHAQFFHRFHNQKIMLLYLSLRSSNEFLPHNILKLCMTDSLSLAMVRLLDRNDPIINNVLIFLYILLPKYKDFRYCLKPYYANISILLYMKHQL